MCLILNEYTRSVKQRIHVHRRNQDRIVSTILDIIEKIYNFNRLYDHANVINVRTPINMQINNFLKSIIA